MRIKAKRVRYAAEAVAPAYGRNARRLAKQAERLQTILGEHQDACEAQAVVRSIASTPSGRASGFTLGLLYAIEERRAAEARIQFAAAWPQVSRRRHRAWLTA